MEDLPMRLIHLRAVALVAAILATPCTVAAQTFGYFGDIGPAFWGGLSPDWTACGAGTMQSPVDFMRLVPHRSPWRKISLNYDPHTTGEIFNNGHTIEVETEGKNTLTLDDIPYKLSQFHFHTASEHRVDGRGYDMELHLVHTAADGSNAVIGVFLTRGRSSGPLAPIFANLPNDVGVHHPIDTPFDPAAFLTRLRDHYHYVGSLTTPPCTEHVQWIVMREPMTISDEDIAQFAERIHFNARPVQRRVWGWHVPD
jgi:carbonic anhydrase